MYTVLFLIGLVVMYFFAITPVTAMAAATLFGLSALYSMLTGVPYFVDSEIPTAVFLGLHLLVTDPSTSPRTPLGRAVFGVLYGLGVFGALRAAHRAGRADLLRQAALRAAPQPDGAGDRSAGRADRRTPLARSRSASTAPIGQRNLAHMAVWIVFFGADDRDRAHRRDAPRRLAAVLAAGVRRGSPHGLRAAAAHRGVVLRRQRRLGVQRAGPPLRRGPAGRRRSRRAPSATSRVPARHASRPAASTCSTRATPAAAESAAARPAPAAARRRA